MIMHEGLDRTIRRGETIIALRAESNDRLNKIEFLEGRLLSLRQRAEHWEKSFCEALKRAEAAELFRATFERPHGLRSGQCCDPVIDGEICALLLRVAAAEATLKAVKAEISGDANFGRMVELLFYGPLREKEEELRLAHGKIAELEGNLAERALGGEGK